jgi:hypothetical protein
MSSFEMKLERLKGLKDELKTGDDAVTFGHVVLHTFLAVKTEFKKPEERAEKFGQLLAVLEIPDTKGKDAQRWFENNFMNLDSDPRTEMEFWHIFFTDSPLVNTLWILMSNQFDTWSWPEDHMTVEEVFQLRTDELRNSETSIEKMKSLIKEFFFSLYIDFKKNSEDISLLEWVGPIIIEEIISGLNTVIEDSHEPDTGDFQPWATGAFISIINDSKIAFSQLRQPERWSNVNWSDKLVNAYYHALSDLAGAANEENRPDGPVRQLFIKGYQLGLAMSAALGSPHEMVTQYADSVLGHYRAPGEVDPYGD